MFVSGFKFGMFLQLAVGPVCLFVFSTANSNGFLSAESAVIAVTVVDSLYILLAILGIASFLENDATKKWLKIFAAIILFLFGIDMILESAGIIAVPKIVETSGQNATGTFMKGFFLTASNPLTILFWSGVFAAKVSSEKFTKNGLFLYSLGAVAATLFFLTLISFAGSMVKYFIPGWFITVLNVSVGAFFIYFATKMVLKKN